MDLTRSSETDRPSSPAPSPTPSTPSTSSLPSSASKHSNHIGAIVGGVIGGVAGLIFLSALLWLLLHRRRTNERTPHPVSLPTSPTSPGLESKMETTESAGAPSSFLARLRGVENSSRSTVQPFSLPPDTQTQSQSQSQDPVPIVPRQASGSRSTGEKNQRLRSGNLIIANDATSSRSGGVASPEPVEPAEVMPPSPTRLPTPPPNYYD